MDAAVLAIAVVIGGLLVSLIVSMVFVMMLFTAVPKDIYDVTISQTDKKANEKIGARDQNTKTQRRKRL